MQPHQCSFFKQPIRSPGLILMISLAWIASGCQSQTMEPVIATPTQTATLPASMQPSPTLSIMQQIPVEWTALESGSHASLECKNCHEVEDGHLVDEPAWFDQVTGNHVPLEDTNQLCEKCHADALMLSLGEKNHADFSCTTCHDAHRLEASCTIPGCHSNFNNVNPLAIPFPHPSNGNCVQAGCHEVVIFTPTPSEAPTVMWNHYDGNHNAVSCAACHDAGRLEVGILDNVWVTINLSKMKYYPSHNLQRSVDCNRCHFPDNPWGLIVLPPESQE